MKRQAIHITPQLNLALDKQERTEIVSGKEKELELALAELLLSAAEQVAATIAQARGGSDESKADS
jgi:hypothetical protein